MWRATICIRTCFTIGVGKRSERPKSAAPVRILRHDPHHWFGIRRNGAGDGFTHNLYVGAIASLVIDDSYFHDAVVGHQVKSRAQSTAITNSRIYGGTDTGSHSIDLPNGGVGLIRDNVIQQGANSDNPAIIHYGGESAAYAGLQPHHRRQRVVNDLTNKLQRAPATPAAPHRTQTTGSSTRLTPASCSATVMAAPPVALCSSRSFPLGLRWPPTTFNSLGCAQGMPNVTDRPLAYGGDWPAALRPGCPLAEPNSRCCDGHAQGRVEP
jgi:hypothetical protein